MDPRRYPHEASLRLLTGIPLFRALAGRTLARLAEGARVIDAARGARLYAAGDRAAGLYVVITGRLKLVLPHGKIVMLIGPHEVIGTSAILLDSLHALSADALTASRLVRLARQAVTDCINEDQQFAWRIITTLSRRLSDFVLDLDLSTGYTARQRLARFLLAQLPPHGTAADRVIVLPARKRVIAAHLNVTQEHFSRVLRDLAASGAVSVKGSTIRVHDEGVLRIEAHGTERIEDSGPATARRRA